jgi:uncharacterized membrane protein YphA (DoxX/SURF4 family)
MSGAPRGLRAGPAAGRGSDASDHPVAYRIGGLWLVSAGHALFAATLIGVGISGVISGRFISIWQSVPHGAPARAVLAYLCAWLSLACGVALLFERSAAIAARALFVYLLAWLLLVKGFYVAAAPAVEVSYQSAGETAVLVAGAWVLQAWFAARWHEPRLRFLTGESGVRLARVLYALAVIAFGLSHFAYLGMTAPLVPSWLGAPAFWAYLTGSAYLAAAAAMLTGVLARLAAALSALQMGLFTLLVWVPPVLTGHPSAGQLSELGVSWALTAAAWVVADSFRGTPWLAVGRR